MWNIITGDFTKHLNNYDFTQCLVEKQKVMEHFLTSLLF